MSHHETLVWFRRMLDHARESAINRELPSLIRGIERIVSSNDGA
jgi:hypothetical protein